jgi:hypothetical protein
MRRASVEFNVATDAAALTTSLAWLAVGQSHPPLRARGVFVPTDGAYVRLGVIPMAETPGVELHNGGCCRQPSRLNSNGDTPRLFKRP